MTEEQRENIIRLRYSGWGYRTIAIAVNLSRDSVRNFCKLKGLDGYADDIVLKNAEEEKDNNVIYGYCIVCGKQMEIKKTGRHRKYCSIECKREKEKNQPNLYPHECIYCGKKFESRSSKQKFCSNNCYIRNRFWKEEDATEIMRLLLSGHKVINAPKWLKDLISS